MDDKNDLQHSIDILITLAYITFCMDLAILFIALLGL